jgi:hypothetical protein
LRQRLDRRRAQASDPIQAGRPQIIAHARRGDHAAIPDQHHAADGEPILHLLDLRPQRRWIGRVAFKHLHRDRQPLARA